MRERDARLYVGDRARVDRRACEGAVRGALERAVALHDPMRREDPQAGVVERAKVRQDEACALALVFRAIGEGGLVTVVAVGDVNPRVLETIAQLVGGPIVVERPDRVSLLGLTRVPDGVLAGPGEQRGDRAVVVGVRGEDRARVRARAAQQLEAVGLRFWGGEGVRGHGALVPRDELERAEEAASQLLRAIDD